MNPRLHKKKSTDNQKYCYNSRNNCINCMVYYETKRSVTLRVITGKVGIRTDVYIFNSVQTVWNWGNGVRP